MEQSQRKKQCSLHLFSVVQSHHVFFLFWWLPHLKWSSPKRVPFFSRVTERLSLCWSQRRAGFTDIRGTSQAAGQPKQRRRLGRGSQQRDAAARRRQGEIPNGAKGSAK